jgi:DNA-binding CsgD family transcriptional regulator
LGGVTTTDPLTSREQEVAILAAAGRRDAELADELGISIRTVQTHLGRVYMKLDIHSRAELAKALLADRSPTT